MAKYYLMDASNHCTMDKWYVCGYWHYQDAIEDACKYAAHRTNEKDSAYLVCDDENNVYYDSRQSAEKNREMIANPKKVRFTGNGYFEVI